MVAPREIELKLVLAEGQAARVPLAPPLAGIPGHRARFVAFYFDTPDHALAKRQLGLRLRRSASTWRATLKAGGTSTAGLHDRPEWEFPASGPRLDLSRFTATPLADVPGAATLHERLAPVLVTEFVRTTWRLEPAPGCRVEVALDVGRILAAGREARIEEVEIELLEGDALAAFDLAEVLATTVAMRPEPASKLARGLELAGAARPRPVRAPRVDLSPAGDDARAAARIAVAAALAHGQANEAGVLASADIEFVHQLRVSLRRLRSALAETRARDRSGRHGALRRGPALGREGAGRLPGLGRLRDRNPACTSRRAGGCHRGEARAAARARTPARCPPGGTRGARLQPVRPRDAARRPLVVERPGRTAAGNAGHEGTRVRLPAQGSASRGRRRAHLRDPGRPGTPRASHPREAPSLRRRVSGRSLPAEGSVAACPATGPGAGGPRRRQRLRDGLRPRTRAGPLPSLPRVRAGMVRGAGGVEHRTCRGKPRPRGGASPLLAKEARSRARPRSLICGKRPPAPGGRLGSVPPGRISA
ncbi:MAG: inorganic triphosphatase [Betaproteobacteria bacterium]|nr:inorganic triphosphatase [Betaproteobacteria bacterium]